MLQQVEYLESTARKLGDFAERVRAVETPLQRCEERLEEALNSPPGAAAAEAVARIGDQIHALRAPLQVFLIRMTGHCQNCHSHTNNIINFKDSMSRLVELKKSGQ